MHNVPRLRIALSIALILSAAGMTPSRSDEVDDYVEAQRVKRKIPGLALLVVQDGEIEKARGYGQANVEHQVPVRPETIFQLGSIGKQFTATGAMMLVEGGRLSLDTRVKSLLPDAPESWTDITVAHLLSHTSGLGDYGKEFNLQRDYTTDELAEMLFAAPLKFAPGDAWAYSNLGYVTLGLVIEKVTGEFYGHLLHERIFKPLGMTCTRIISEADIVPHRAAGYRLDEGELKNQRWVAPTVNTTADGSLYSNILDLAKWSAALDEGKLLKPASLERMWTPVTLNDGSINRGRYGYGWFCDELNGHTCQRHGGAWQGFTAHLVRFPDDRLTVIALTNLSSDSFAGLQEIADHVAGMYVPALAGDE